MFLLLLLLASLPFREDILKLFQVAFSVSAVEKKREKENSLKAGEMVKQFKAPAAFAENTDLVLSMVARSCM